MAKADLTQLSEAQRETLLTEIRDNFTLDRSEWQSIRAEGAKDMLCVAGKPWQAMDAAGLRQRKDAHRPALALDELGQHCNQVINSVRANPRSPKFSPTGNGANDKSAQFYEDKWREIEYRSHAQIAYIAAFENALQRSYGFVRVRTAYESDRSMNQDLWIEAIPNPDMVLPDARALKPDSSDMRHCFVYEPWQKAEFQQSFPDATVTDFSNLAQMYPVWIQDKTLLLAEYWKVTTDEIELVQVQHPDGQVSQHYADESLPEGAVEQRRRPAERPSVVQYLTNGVEILEVNPWQGKYIPIVSCYGKVIYVDEGSGPKRQLLSMIRLARDPYMLYCYYRTCQAELVGMTPKFPYFFYDGQLSPESLTTLAKSLHEPVAGIAVKPTIPGVPAGQVLPVPSRQPYDPPIQALEIGAEAARRAIMSAMGLTPLPTSAQRQNEKSGVALKKISDQQQQGAFHFVDHFNDMLRQIAVIGEDLLDKVLDTARDTSTRTQKDTTVMVRVNDPQARDKNGQPAPVSTTGDHAVTISVGPTSDSERDAATDFVTNFVSGPVMQLVPPPVRPKILAAAIRLQNIGPQGEEMADLLDPPPDKGHDPQQMLAQAAHENQALKQKLGEASQIIQTKQVEQQGRLTEMKIKASADLQQTAMNNATKIAVARISAAKASFDSVREGEEEALALGQQQQAQASQNALDRQHELNAAEQAHGQALGQAQQAHDHATAQAEQAGMQQMAIAQQPPDVAGAPV